MLIMVAFKLNLNKMFPVVRILVDILFLVLIFMVHLVFPRNSTSYEFYNTLPNFYGTLDDSKKFHH